MKSIAAYKVKIIKKSAVRQDGAFFSLSKNPCFHQTKTGVLVYLGIKKSNI